MSPKVAMVLDTSAAAMPVATPMQRLRRAVRIAQAQGLRVNYGAADHGVVRGRLTGEWVSDRNMLPARTVSVVGAVLVALQPVVDDEDYEGAAVVALSCSMAWLVGVVDGMNADVSSIWLGGASASLYRSGVRDGGALFGELTVECEACGRRRPTWEDGCAGCEDDRLAREDGAA